MKYTFSAVVKEFTGTHPWVYVEVPKTIEKEVFHGKKNVLAKVKKWNFVPISVSVRNTTWGTSLLPLGNNSGYFIPLKANIRKKEGIVVGKRISLSFVV
ncbi:MAG: DUF1905 domain-containing protein [Candidatus Paceibacterota bacterium]